MKSPLLLLLIFATFLISQWLLGEEPEVLINRATLLFSDDFNRADTDPTHEQLGRQWVTNSETRAQGKKQAFLKNSTLRIAMAEAPSHGASVRHDAPFDDGIVQVRFQLHDEKGIKFNFNDPNARDLSWAGHIARVVVTPNSISIGDDKTRVFDLKLREQRQSKTLDKRQKARIAAFLQTKVAHFTRRFELDHWYDLTIVVIGPQFEVYIDEKKVGQFTSEGLDHSVKQNLAFGVSGSATVDDLKIWSLDH